jgi:GDSL-like Lipase/Acylhydrolase family
MPEIVLLGDSTLDNAAYTYGDPDVVTRLRTLLPAGWSATLLAVDGSTTEHVPAQVQLVPAGATHLVLSVGGNDALAHADILEQRVPSAAQALGRLADAAHQFERRYRAAVEITLQRGLPTALCTIYNGSFPDPVFQRLASTALTVFNDAILRVAFERGLPVIDLRLICTTREDYINSIEPSSLGGTRIARAIVRALGLTSPQSPASVVTTSG